MRFAALATDYDGTLAKDGSVDEQTLAALQKLGNSGRKLILVTGRELGDLCRVFPQIEVFDRVVAENGALLYDPSKKQQERLCEAPLPGFLEALQKKGVPFSQGQCIVATWEPHQHAVLETIKELGLELQVIFNKGAVMVLPAGVNKKTGLRRALKDLCLSPHNVAAIGDAENDHAFLKDSECSVAVGNALPALKVAADLVFEEERGAAVSALADQMVEDDLARYDDRLSNAKVLAGRDKEGDAVHELTPNRGVVLICGPSGSGKSTFITGLVERMAKKSYQYCLIDPEGDYDNLPGVVAHGTEHTAPDVEQILKSLYSAADQCVVANLVGLPLQDRPTFFASLMPRVEELRHRTGHPHWIVVDEAHHLMPQDGTLAPSAEMPVRSGMLLITVHPDMVSRTVLGKIDTLVAIGATAYESTREFCVASGCAVPRDPGVKLQPGEALIWRRAHPETVSVMTTEPGTTERRRHVRKYFEGELPQDRSFYFIGPRGDLNLRAHNLMMFSRIAEGVDEGTWLYHLRRGDYSRWVETAIKDAELSRAIAQVEAAESDATASRKEVEELIRQRYTV